MKTKKLAKKFSVIIPVIVFAVFSVFGLSIFTFDKNDTNVNKSKASAQEPADINSDGTVNIFDLSTLLSNWNKTGTNTSDLNNDSTVNIFDLSMMLSKWGSVQTTTLSNLARTSSPAVTVTASSQDTGAGQGAINVIDGSILGYPVDDTKEWSTIGGHVGSWVQLTWASPVTLSKVVLYDRPNTADQITGGNLTFSDGSTVTVPTLNNDGSATTISFNGRTVTSVRLNITAVSGSTANIGLAELEAWGFIDGATNHAPVANAGSDQNTYVNSLVTLNGSGSTDPDGNAITYVWTQTSGGAVTLSSTTASNPTFTPTSTGTYVFSLVVRDGALSSAADTVTIIVATQPPVGTLNAQDLANINTKRVMFGHQSVGGNIMDGIPAVYTSYGAAQPNFTGSSIPASGGYFGDFYVGQNYDPIGKIADFNTFVRQNAARIDVALFKFCFVDISSSTNAQQLFNTYKSTMDALIRDYPNIKFIHTTAALDEWDTGSALVREQYNALIRQTYGSSGRVFDLAKVESTRPDGTRVSGTSGSSTYYQLYDPYSSDGGHLNATGSQVVAKELLTIIAGAIR